MKHQQQLIYPKGTVTAAGLFFELGSPFVGDVNAQMLTHWLSGSAIFQADTGRILLWPAPQKIDINRSPGNALIKQGKLISNTLLSASALAHFEDDTEQFYITSQGALFNTPVARCQQIPQETLLDVSDWTLVTMSPLSKKPGKPVVKQKPISGDLRKVMAGQGLEASPQLRARLQEMDKIKPGTGNTGSVLSSLMAGTSGAIKGFKSLFSQSESGEPSPDSFTENQQSSGLFEKLKDVIAQNIMLSKLGNMIGRQQAKHMQQMLNLFGQKDLTQALKNAVPLDNMESAMRTSRPSLGKPGSRSNLNINTHSAGSISGYGLEMDMLSRMRQVYEAAFKKLDNAGDYQKAAFVLAELLKEVDRAVAYLEKHKEFRLAALLAEGQKLPAARVIRQWVLADDIQRAVHIAKISGYYEHAITALGKDHQAAAHKLRWELAKQHAASGNMFTACELAWPLQEKRTEVLKWMRQCADSNSAASAVMLLRLAEYEADNMQTHLQKLHDLIMLDSPARQAIRNAVINEVINRGKTTANKLLADLLIRLYLEDVAQGKSGHNPMIWKRLLEISDNQALRADTRNLGIRTAARRIPLEQMSPPLQLEFPACYGRTPSDVALLCNGCFLVAFGESGVELWTATGKKKHSWFVPCHQIVMSDQADQALLLASRGHMVSLHKFSLDSLQVSFWQDIALDCWADNYDGLTWMVAKSDMLWALDLSEDESTAIWSVSDLGGAVTQIKREPERLGVILAAEERFELWIYKLPDLFLKERSPHYQQQFTGAIAIDFHSDGHLLTQHQEFNHKLGYGQQLHNCQWFDVGAPVTPESARLHNNWLRYCTKSPKNSMTLQLLNIQHNGIDKIRLSAACAESQTIQCRITAGNILLWTDNGRIILVDESGSSLVTTIVV